MADLAREPLPDRAELDTRRERLAKRRTNLSRARALLDSLTTNAAASGPAGPAPPDSLSALRAIHSSLAVSSGEVLIQMEDALVRSNRDLHSAFAFELASTFSDSSSDPFTSDAASSHSSLGTPETSYVIAELAIPRLSDLARTPPVALSTVLSHLVHLVRLLALYYKIELPFIPNPNLFEPGRPGVVAAPGWTTGAASNGFACFISRRAKNRSAVTNAGGSTEGPEQSGGRELDRSLREEEERAARTKAIVGGAVALAYDFAWIVWKRGGEHPAGNPEALDDFGALVLKALGGWPKDRYVTLGTAPSLSTDSTSDSATPATSLPALPSRSAKFSLDFAAALKAYSAPAGLGETDPGMADDTAEDGWDLV